MVCLYPRQVPFSAAIRQKELAVNPTANLNPRPSSPGPCQAGVVYQPNGNAVTSSYGGGVSVQLPF